MCYEDLIMEKNQPMNETIFQKSFVKLQSSHKVESKMKYKVLNQFQRQEGRNNSLEE